MKLAKLGIVLSSLVISQVVHAGASNGDLNCVSKTGRTKVQASMEVDLAGNAINVTIDGATKSYVDQATKEDEELNSGLYDLSKYYPNYSIVNITKTHSKAGISLVAFESNPDAKMDLVHFSLKSTSPIKFGVDGRGSFNAVLKTIDPRSQSEKYIENIALDCKYSYTL